MPSAKRPTQVPTAAELMADPVVQAVLEQAWHDSQPDDEMQRHEEGGWIYVDLTTGQLTIQRASRGSQALIDLGNPPMGGGSMIVGKFHTHPNPISEGWLAGPSHGDQVIDAIHGVPDLIRAEDGIYLSGPDSRRGGLTGGSGYPP